VPEPKRKPRKKIAAQTAEPLKPAEPLVKDDPVQKVLGVIYSAAMEGNVSAAKLYLDFCTKQSSGEASGLTADDALKLLQESQ
jgi:hypothetical protein